MILYRAAHVNQVTVDLGDGLGMEPIVDEDEAIRTAMRICRDVTRKAGCDETVVVLSSVKSDSFRHRLWPAYKANRKAPKPVAYDAVRAALSDEYEVMAVAGLEADDLLGIHGTAPDADAVVVSWDKDMQTLPTFVFNPDHDDKPVLRRQAVADRWWLRQTMIGDTVDGYPGINKVGPVAAAKILDAPHRLRKTVSYVGKRAPKQVVKWVEGEPCSVWQSMVDYAARAGMTEADLIVQAQLARILRHGDYDENRRTVQLWTPTGKREFNLDT